MDLSNEYNLRPMWSAILDVYQEVATILRTHGLPFWAAYGTVLGAIRHGGFIPWDDDFDICVPNDLFDKVCEVLTKELPSGLKLVTPYNTPELRATFAKVQVSSEEVVKRVERAGGYAMPHGIYIDIFTLDGVPDSAFARIWLQIKSWLLFCHWSRLFNVDSRKTWRYYLGNVIAQAFLPFFCRIKTEPQIQKAKLDWARKYTFKNCKRCGRFLGGIHDNYPWRALSEDFAETVMVKFEDTELPIPKGYRDYLKANYGDYMQLPPEGKRVKPYHGDLAPAPWRFGPTNT